MLDAGVVHLADDIAQLVEAVDTQVTLVLEGGETLVQRRFTLVVIFPYHGHRFLPYFSCRTVCNDEDDASSRLGGVSDGVTGVGSGVGSGVRGDCSDVGGSIVLGDCDKSGSREEGG